MNISNKLSSLRFVSLFLFIIAIGFASTACSNNKSSEDSADQSTAEEINTENAEETAPWQNDDVEFTFTVLGNTFDCAKNQDEDLLEKGIVDELYGHKVLVLGCEDDLKSTAGSIEFEVQVDVGEELSEGDFNLTTAENFNLCLANEDDCSGKGKALTKPEGEEADMKYVKVSTSGKMQISKVQMVEDTDAYSRQARISGTFTFTGRTALPHNDTGKISGSFKNVLILIY